MMRAITGKDTAPEMIVRRGLHARGLRFRLHDDRLPGKPDLVLRRWRAVIFVHGCFWHGHDCAMFRWPKTRAAFWFEKISRNRTRDAETEARLDAAGWRVLKIWECSVKGPGRIGGEPVCSLAAAWLRSGAGSGEIKGKASAGK